MSGIVRQISGDLSKTKTKGKAFVSALNNALKPIKIANEKPQTQPCKSTKKY